MAEEICCHPNCREKVSKGHIACPFHWRSVGATIQRQVQWRLRGWTNDDGSTGNRTCAVEYLNHFFRKHQGGQL
jgi:hypothetical protein